jgi:tetratricopeptide (TPR) repeat protein
MLTTALFDPDVPRSWMRAPGHNPTVSILIRRALRKLREGLEGRDAERAENALGEALAQVAPCLHLRRSPHQDMFLAYVRGAALVGLKEFGLGAEHLYAAVYYAEACGDLFAGAELADQLGKALRGIGEYCEALDVYRDGLSYLERLPGLTPLQHPSAMHLQLGLSAVLQATERYDEALVQLTIARAAATTLDDDETLAGIDYTEALVLRAQGHPLPALGRILAAQEGHVAADSRLSRLMLGRTYAMVAQIAIDVAEMYVQRGSLARPSTYLELAGIFSRRGLAAARASGDPGARFSSVLAEAQLARVSGRAGSARIVLEPLLNEAAQLHDPYLILHVHTAIGQDYAASGDDERATAHFRQAMHQAEAVSGTADGRVARLALLRAGTGH